MNKDQVKGKMNDIKGRVERQAGEWTGDTESQIKGAGDQIKGKVQQGVGKMKEAGERAARDVRSKGEREGSDVRHDEQRDRKVA
jgi:uncharacterized protein YjbJ (UPF0337 family)